MTLLTAGALTDPRLPATASNMCTTYVRLGGVGRVAPPDTNPGYAGAAWCVLRRAMAALISSVLLADGVCLFRSFLVLKI